MLNIKYDFEDITQIADDAGFVLSEEDYDSIVALVIDNHNIIFSITNTIKEIIQIYYEGKDDISNLTRDDKIAELVQYDLDFCDDPHWYNILKEGFKGYENMDDEELGKYYKRMLLSKKERERK